MKILRNVSIICFVLLGSCSIDDKSFDLSQDQLFYKKVSKIIENQSAYSSLTPQKINPFIIELSLPTDGSKSRTGSQDEALETSKITEEIANASLAFQDLSTLLISTSSELDLDLFNKLSYSIEFEILASDLTEAKKEYLLKEISVLKYLKTLRAKQVLDENSRILCDSQFKCDWMACMDEKITEAFESADTWIETAALVYSLASGGVIIMEVACAYEVWPD